MRPRKRNHVTRICCPNQDRWTKDTANLTRILCSRTSSLCVTSVISREVTTILSCIKSDDHETFSFRGYFTRRAAESNLFILLFFSDYFILSVLFPHSVKIFHLKFSLISISPKYFRSCFCSENVKIFS